MKLDIRNLSFKSLFIILFFLLIAIVILLKFILPNQKVSAAWFNDSWMYRKAVSITNSSGSNLTDFQVSLSIGTSSLINAGKMKSDCSDIRITDNTGKLLNFWIEENNPGCNTPTDTKIWVKAPSLPTSGATVFVYYSNPSATSVQNGEQVFEFFDDFNGSSINASKWTNSSSATINLSGGTASFTETSDNINQNVYTTSYNSTGSVIFESRQNVTTTTATEFGGLSMKSDNALSTHKYKVGFATGGYSFWYWNSSTYTQSAGSTVPTSGYSINRLTFTGTAYQAFVNGTQVQSNMTNEVFAKNVPAITPGLQDGIVYVDWLIARKYASTTPTSSLQSEELSPAPIAYWKFDEGIGSTAYDSTSNANNGIFGTGSSAPTWQTEDQCISGKCLYFNGNSYVDPPDTITDFSGMFTINLWAKWTSLTGNQELIGKDQDSSNIAFILFKNTSNKIQADIKSPSGEIFSIAHPTTIQTNTWYHISAVMGANSNLTLYINAASPTTTTMNYRNNLGNFLIGKTPDSYWGQMNGFIDEPKIYPYARTPAQIKSDYAAGKAHASTNKGTSANLGSNNKNGDFLSNGLVGYWKMDENIGTTTADSSGNSNTGTFGTGNSAPTWSNGKFGVGTSFDGSNDYIDAGNVLNMGTNDMTISAWIKSSSNATSQFIVSKSLAGGQNYRYGVGVSNTVAKLFMQGDGGADVSFIGSKIVNDGSWHNITYIFDRDNKASIYVDGVYDTGQTISQWNGKNMVSTNPFRIGAYTTADNVGVTSLFNGNIDEVRIYNRALSPAEVSNLYNWAPGPVFYWDFNEGTGTTAFDKQNNTNLPISNATYTSGKYGSGLNFAGNAWLEKAISPSIGAAQDYTQCLWFYPTSTASRQVLVDDSNQWEHWIAMNANKTMTGCYYNTVQMCANSTNTVNLNTWNYVCLAYKNNQSLDLSVNGTPWATNTNVGTSASKIYNDVCIGKAGGGSSEKFTGKIDDVKIYNYARTQKQIVEDMNAGHPAAGSPVGSQIGYWKFDEGFGSFTNNSGNGGIGLSGVFGTGNSAPTWTNDGKFSKALSFNGSTNYINFGNNASVQNDTAVTISAWIKKNNSTGIQTIASQGGANCPPYYMYQFKTDTNKLYMMLFGPDSYYYYAFPNAIVSNNVWQYVAIVINDGTTTTDTGTATVYIDGVNKGSTTWTGNRMKESGKNFYIGTNAWSCNIPTEFFNGLIDEVKIYNYALTADEIKLDYNRGSALQMGSLSSGAGNTAPSTAGSQEYCIPGDASACSAPIAEYKFEEGVGTTARDTSGNNNHGVFGTGNSAPTWTTGKQNSGSGLKFDGKQKITVTDNDILKPTTAITTEAWFNTTNKTIAQKILSKTESSGYQLSLNENGSCPSSTLCFLININGTYHSASYAVSNLSNNTWYHVAGLYDGSTVKLFLNGSNIGTTDIVASTITQGAYNLCIGSETDSGACTSSFFNGKIDNVKIYNYARTPAQIAWDYNRGGPIGWWKFDECQGGTVFDSSGVGNTGAISIGLSGSQTSLGTCQVGTSAAWTTGASGKINSSLNFDGVDDYVWLGSPSILSPNNLTISSWFKISSNISGTIIRNRTSGYGLGLLSGNVYVNVFQSTGSNLITSSPLTYGDNNWHLATFTYDGTTIKLYIDGRLVNSNTGTGTGTIYYSGNAVGVGRDADYSGSYFTGQIDDVRIYNYALTSEQIKTLFNGGSVSFN